jgi:hypothetical protein
MHLLQVGAEVAHRLFDEHIERLKSKEKKRDRDDDEDGSKKKKRSSRWEVLADRAGVTGCG